MWGMRISIVAVSLLSGTVRSESPEAWYSDHESQFIDIYKWFHQHPEVSFEEQRTAAKLADLWRSYGFEVTENVGGYGVVGILENGAGPTVMLRTDLDALPVTEQTPLQFASTAKTELAGGGTAGVMHACGHDVHMTNLAAVSQFLASHRSQWSGRLMVIGQPAEERGAGARAMLEDGLFTRFPKPDYALALHVDAQSPAGTVQVAEGFILANVDSVDITVQGRGGHGSAPHTAIDPIVQAADLIMSLQTIVSREVKPIESAVVTVGAINGGTKHNIIPDTCHLQITVRSYKDEIRAAVLAAIERRANAVAMAYGAPAPKISISEGTPALENDTELARAMADQFKLAIGEANVLDAEQSMGGEDFSQYGRAGVPILMYRLGSVSPERLNRFEQLGTGPPSLHSATYYPNLDPTLKIGFMTMTAGVLRLMPPRADQP
jgi:hippurate hydrolase